MFDYSTLMILNHADIRSKIKNKRSRLIEIKKNTVLFTNQIYYMFAKNFISHSKIIQ
jgi:hypothetical protein